MHAQRGHHLGSPERPQHVLDHPGRSLREGVGPVAGEEVGRESIQRSRIGSIGASPLRASSAAGRLRAKVRR